MADEAFMRANEALRQVDIYAAVIDLFPRPATPARVLDLGSGTGRDAGWFADQGHTVVAVEPVSELRDAARRLHPSPGITHVDDSLPDIAAVKTLGRFDFVLLSGVWQHLDDGERQGAMASLQAVTAEGGRVALSLRHGPGAPGRPVHPVDVDATVLLASAHGFGLQRRATVDSVQPGNIARGVTWTWLVMDRNSPDAAR